MASFPRESLERSIPSRLREQVELHADRPAVRYDGEEVTYEALFRRVLKVAALIDETAGGTPGAVVVLVPQGVEQIAAILGVLETGDWYVPLDLNDSNHRLRDLVARSEAKLILASGPTLALASESASGRCPIARVDQLTGLAARAGAPPRSSDSLAYVYFTSGSTGQPKGVMDSHRNVIHNILRYTQALRWSAEDRLTLLQASHFSGAVSNVFGTLLNGALLLPYDVARDGAGAPLARWIERERPTIYHSVPSLFRSVCLPGARFPSVRVVRLEGDAAAPGDVERFARHFESGTLLVNGLGATETGICSQHFVRQGDRPPADALPVGHAVEDMDVRVIDEQGAPVASGEVGEIAVRSRYLALGYWRDPERTALAFRADTHDPSIREYRTGDLGRTRRDGGLEHLGRRDSQLKVRGQWVDSVAVESRLAELAGIAEAAVGLQRDGDDELALAAYVVPVGGTLPSMRALRSALAADLPAHAVPTRAYAVAALPLGPNRKLDRRALTPSLGRPLPEGGGDGTPRDHIEARLVEIWKDVLGLDRVGVHETFIELGGDSLKAVQVVLAIEKGLGVCVPHSVLVMAPTIADLAPRLGHGVRDRVHDSLVQHRTSGTRPPLFCVHDLESDGFLFAPLAHRLGLAQPVYGLRHPAGEPVGPVPRSIEALASRYVADLTAVASGGPYQIVGFCFGGVVALEMARQLAARGDRVSLLALINVTAYDLFALASPRAQRRFKSRWSARIRYLVRKPDAPHWIARRLARAAADLTWRMLLPLRLATLGAQAPASPALLHAALRQAFRRYQPRSHQGRVILFLADETLPLYADDPHEAWAGLSSGPVEIHRLPHDGYSMLIEPDVARLVEWLRPHLAKEPIAPDGWTEALGANRR